MQRDAEHSIKMQAEQEPLSRIFLLLTLAFCAVLGCIAFLLATRHAENDLHSFSEPVYRLSEGWTMTNGAGVTRTVSLPQTVDYGREGTYTLSCVLPDTGGKLTSPAFRFYSNYVDLAVYLEGEELYRYPEAKAAFSGATGNTYHFIRMPDDYAGKTVKVEVRGQLGNDISYLLNPPLLGSKGTMLKQDVLSSLASFTLSGCMAVLAIGLGILYLVFRRRLAVNNGTLYMALFTFLFSLYVFFETGFAQQMMPNGYLLCYVTLTLLALVPLPLIGVFLNAVSRRFKPAMYGLMTLTALNFAVQTVLNMTGVKSMRVMLPGTHVLMILCIVSASACLFFSDRKEKPEARRSLLSAIPMIAGGTVDIVLLNLNRPSLNNCFWFALGVTLFILLQLSGFVRNYFKLYRTAIASEVLNDMAYHDTLAGIGNRNAYERRLKELNREEPLEKLSCIVMDINDLKLINDTLGHQAGDTAIAQVGAVLRAFMPENAACFRTGGDEFVALLEGCDEERTAALVERLLKEAKARGVKCGVPIRLAAGFGQYNAADGNILDFIRRVDTLMYQCKRRQKNEQRS